MVGDLKKYRFKRHGGYTPYFFQGRQPKIPIHQTEYFPPKTGNKALATLFIIELEDLSSAIRQIKEIKGKRRNITLSIHRCHDCLKRKSQEIYKKKFPELSKFIKATEYKINIQKISNHIPMYKL